MSSTSFVSQHVLQGIHVIWCINTIIGEWAVEAIQMKVHSDVSVLMTLGHGTKVTQITYLTAPCWIARRLKWTLGSLNLDSGWKSYASGKIIDAAMSVRSAWLRPAGLAPPPKHFPLSIVALRTHQWTPKHLGDMSKAKLRPKGLIRPSDGLLKLLLEVVLIIHGWTCTCMQRNHGFK